MKVLTFPTGALDTNTYLAHDGNDALVIDPGADSPALWQELDAQKLTVKALLLTHTHFDHMLGLPALLARTGASLSVPAADEAGLTDGNRNLLSLWNMGELPPLVADLTVVEGSTVTVGSMVLSTLHTPGHTPGSSCFLAGDVLFSGDTLFDGGYGRTDLPGGSYSQLTRSLARLETLPRPLTVYPGHGGAFIWR